jgi:hypothetical protein
VTGRVVATGIVVGVAVVAVVAVVTVGAVTTVTTVVAVATVVGVVFGIGGVAGALRVVVAEAGFVGGLAGASVVRGASTGTASGKISGGAEGSAAGAVVMETMSPTGAAVAEEEVTGLPTLGDGLIVLSVPILAVRVGCVRFTGTGFTVDTGPDDPTREAATVVAGRGLVVGLVALVV